MVRQKYGKIQQRTQRIQIYKKKHCEGLRKHIANLERRLLKHALANVILSIISVAAIIALFTLIQN